MKTILIVAALMMSQNSLAHGPFLDAMKVMGENFKSIGVGLKNGEMTSTELESSETLQMAIAEASLYFPKTADTDALKMEYSRWMAELNLSGLQLEEFIEDAMTGEPQDLKAVKALFKKINALRKKGHDKFKDDHDDE